MLLQSVKTCQKTVACQNVSNPVKKVSKKCQKRVKTCQKNTAMRCGVSCQNVSKKAACRKMFARTRVSKNGTLVFASCFVSKRVNKLIFWHSRFLQMAAGRLEMAPRTLQILTNRVKKCQAVSKSVKKRWKCKKTQCFCRVSKRVKTCQKTVACQNVSKRVKKVSKKCQKSVKNVSKRIKTCQKITAVRCFVSKRVKQLVFWHFPALFLTLTFVF